MAEWHPFVGAGVGAVLHAVEDNGQTLGGSETKAGFNVGGGVEYFTGRTVSLKGEARYHMIGRRSRSRSVGPRVHRWIEEVLVGRHLCEEPGDCPGPLGLILPAMAPALAP